MGMDLDEFISEPSEALVSFLRDWNDDIFVLGAGGKMGLHLCMMLRKGLDRAGRNCRVTAISRYSSLFSRNCFESAGIATIAGDLRNPDFLTSLPDHGTVFFLAGAKFGTAGRPDLLQEMNVDLPKAVGEHFRSSRIVAFSTGCVYSYVHAESGGSLESAPTEAPGNYARSCLGREEAFREASRRHGNPVVLIRLNYAVELRYGVFTDIGERVRSGEPIDVSMGFFNAIWQGDALDHIIRSSGLARSPATEINISGAEILYVRDVACQFGERLKTPVKFIGKEAETAWLSNASRSHTLFGAPRFSSETIIDWVSRWLWLGLETHGKPTGFERRDGEF